MPRDGTSTRLRILDAAHGLIMERGFSGTSVDDVLAAAEVTKGAFFHHFPSKADLARTLLHQYVAADLDHLDTTMARAEGLTTDPLQQLLVFIGLYREELAEVVPPHDGCLMATYTYESGLFGDEFLDIIQDNFQTWHDRMSAKLAEVAAVHPPRVDVDLDSLADSLLVLVEGGFVLTRVLKDPEAIAGQLAHLRTYLELLFGA
jgi:TetR/AcrR family transcriptional regulator, transcriptional repressor for nem operon